MNQLPDVQVLSPEEERLVFRAPALVTVLIAAADEDIAKKELDRSNALVALRSAAGEYDLQDYYESAKDNFLKDVQEVIEQQNGKTHSLFLAEIEDELRKLNDILSKMSSSFAMRLVKSLRSLAMQTAKSHGGVVGIGTVSIQEKFFAELRMITFNA